MVQSELAKFRLTEDQRSRYDNAARRFGLSFSRFARRSLDQAALGLDYHSVRESFVAVRKLINQIEHQAQHLDPEAATKLRALVADLRRIAARHLQVV